MSISTCGCYPQSHKLSPKNMAASSHSIPTKPDAPKPPSVSPKSSSSSLTSIRAPMNAKDGFDEDEKIEERITNTIVCIAAIDENNIYGSSKENKMLWSNEEDMDNFRVQTTYNKEHGMNALVMGKNTWESMNKRVLKNRITIVVTTDHELSKTHELLRIAHSPQKAIKMALDDPDIDNVFCIGGASIWEAGIKYSHEKKECWLSHIPIAVSTTNPLFFPLHLLSHVRPVYKDYGFKSFRLQKFDIGYHEHIFNNRYTQYERYLEKPPEEHSKCVYTSEYEYLWMVDHVIQNGEIRKDRTGTGTVSVFGPQTLTFDLQDGFPLLTTKKMHWKSIVHELLWFLKGDTYANRLKEEGVHIWDGNSTREFLDERGLTYKEGLLGPVYGWQWRAFGAEYDMEKALSGDVPSDGMDQIQYVIDTLRDDPFSRRAIVSAWNPKAMSEMALPPCHVLFQFSIRYRNRYTGENRTVEDLSVIRDDDSREEDVYDAYLDCALTQRSIDLGLGAPFNIASYSLLIVMMARALDVEPGQFIYHLNDAHVYLNHIDALKKQLERPTLPLCSVSVRDEAPLMPFDLSFDDIVLDSYVSHSGIKMKMAV